MAAARGHEGRRRASARRPTRHGRLADIEEGSGRHLGDVPGPRCLESAIRPVTRFFVDWDESFGTLHSMGLDCIMTICVFERGDRARQSCELNVAEVRRRIEVARWS